MESWMKLQNKTLVAFGKVLLNPGPAFAMSGLPQYTEHGKCNHFSK